MLRAADLMRRDFHRVAPEISVAELDEAFGRFGVSGFPVTVGQQAVGVVSRADVLRCLNAQLSYAAGVGDFYRDSQEAEPGEWLLSNSDEGAIAGARLAKVRVEDIMTRSLISVAPSDSVESVARILVAHRVHRVLVVEGWRLTGIVSSTDIVRAVGEGRLVSSKVA